MIRNLEIGDLDALHMLSDTEFGEGFHSSAHFLKYIDIPGNIAFGYFDNDDLAGFILVENMTKDQFIRKIKNYPIDARVDQNFVYLDSIIVDPGKQKQGIGFKLLLALEEFLPDKGMLIALGWKNINGINVKPLFLKSGFIEADEIKNIWTEDCHNDKFECPFKSDPCSCSVNLFIKMIG